jgi:YjbE family integral membrane protein
VTDFFIALIGILFLNLLLSGDNAVVIAMASSQLPERQRKQAIFWGCGAAVILRTALTIVASRLLAVPYLQFIGGLVLLWIAVKLLSQKDTHALPSASSLSKAIQMILFADLIMSLDNVLSLAAIAQTVPANKYALITIGLVTSIPLVVFGAQLLVKIIRRYPATLYAGAGILGYAAAELMLNDLQLGILLKQQSAILKTALPLGVMGMGYLKSRAFRRLRNPGQS